MDRPLFLAALKKLSPRETQVMERVAQGEGNEEIAQALVISEATVELHRRHAMTKMRRFNGDERMTPHRFIAYWWQWSEKGRSIRA